MDKRIFIFRNFISEPLFDKISGCKFSGYGETDFETGYQYYIWFYSMLLKVNLQKTTSKIDFYIKNIEFLKDKIPSGNTFLYIKITDSEAFDFVADDPVRKMLNQYNDFIYYLANIKDNIKAIDFNTFKSTYSRDKLLDNRHFFMSQLPVNPKLADDFRKWFLQKIDALEGKRKKCLVLDLDNTLWCGILGEDGISGIKLGNTYHVNCFVSLQAYLKEIKNTGIILTICSKNNAGNVKQLFVPRDDMVLKEKDFIVKKNIWKNKSYNINEIAQELNIGTNSIVFVNDCKFECEQVKMMLPEVVIPEFPKQPYMFVNFVKDLYNNWFQVYQLTVEDRKTTEQYRQNTLRRKSVAQHGTVEDFLRQMEVHLIFPKSNPMHLPRIAQMTQKTNQFNFITKRYTESDVRAMLENGSIIWDAAVADKCGDNRITATAILKIEDDNAEIDSFLLNCQILGRGIETAFLNIVFNRLFYKGFKTVVASYILTTKSKQIADFYHDNGFGLVSTDSGQTKIFAIGTHKKKPISDFFEIFLKGDGNDGTNLICEMQRMMYFILGIEPSLSQKENI